MATSQTKEEMHSQGEKYFIAEYIWSGGRTTFDDFRSKCRTMYIPYDSPVTMYPQWNFDGSSTGQALNENTEIILAPKCVYVHPFLEHAKVVLCECYYTDGQPTLCNTRKIAREIFDAHTEMEPWFGLEQEYVLYNYRSDRLLGWPESATEYPAPQGPYYCGTGSHVVGREIAEHHYALCLRMGLRMSGMNAEVLPGQWEFQVGPCLGIEGGDHLFVARWVYARLAEQKGLRVGYESKPVSVGDWNGSGCHVNYSTKAMRQEGGLTHIEDALTKMAKTVSVDIAYYGTDNQLRLTGKHETSRLDTFTWGIGTRHTSVRIPQETKALQRGYFEDRRPAAGIDPYLVTCRIFMSTNGLTHSQMDNPEKIICTMPTWMKEIVNKQKKSS